MAQKFLSLALFASLSIYLPTLCMNVPHETQEDLDLGIPANQQVTIPLPVITQPQLLTNQVGNSASSALSDERSHAAGIGIEHEASHDDLRTFLLSHGAQAHTETQEKNSKKARFKALISVFQESNKNRLKRFQHIRKLVLKITPEAERWYALQHGLTRATIEHNRNMLVAKNNLLTASMLTLAGNFFPGLTTLNLNQVRCDLDALTTLTPANFPHLIRLYLQQCLIEPQQLSHLEPIASQLQTLDISNNNSLTQNDKTTQESALYLLYLLRKLSSLRNFCCKMINAEHLKALAEASTQVTELSVCSWDLKKKLFMTALPFFKNLRHLAYSAPCSFSHDFEMPDEDFFAQIASSSQTAQLQTLHLTTCGITDRSFAEHIAKFTSLESLSVSWNLVQDAGLEALAVAPYAEKLTHLNMRRNGNSSTQGRIKVETLVKCLPKFKSLAYLNIDSHTVINEVLIALAEAPCATTLTELILENDWRTQKDGFTDKVFIKHITSFSNLQTLNLRHHERLTEKSFIALADSPLAKTLKKLELDGRMVSQKVYEDHRHKFSEKCKIVRYS